MRHEERPASARSTERLIVGGRVGGTAPGDDAYPAWFDSSYVRFREQVLNPAYPCFFGIQAEHRGEMFYTTVPYEEPEALAAGLRTFVRLGQQERYRRFNLAAFFEPVCLPPDHQALQHWFWREMRILHELDRHHDTHGPFIQPDDPDWEFCFHGSQMFVVVASPTYRRRRSRCLGPGIVLLFQPRAVFLDLITSQPIAAGVRDRIRARLRAWDLQAPHPDLGFFGEPGNREWKQYCLPDDDEPAQGACPFTTRQRVGA